MSNGFSPCNGYVLKIDSDTSDMLKVGKEFTLFLEEWEEGDDPKNYESSEDFSNAFYLKWGMRPELFYKSDGDCYDDIEDGLYLYFHESDLYTKKETDKYRKFPLRIEFKNWTKFS